MLLLSVLSLVFSTFERPTAQVSLQSALHPVSVSATVATRTLTSVSRQRDALPANLSKQKTIEVIRDMRHALEKYVPYAKNSSIREAAGIQSQGYIQKFKNGNINTVTPTVRKLYAYLQSKSWIS